MLIKNHFFLIDCVYVFSAGVCESCLTLCRILRGFSDLHTAAVPYTPHCQLLLQEVLNACTSV